ncbi:GAF domain-containing protein [Chamaesiphon sp. GL140_3_metabinner_50]|uniref:sensor histidine kinase n=1 Tax=Chamaesiphon sp. GL140_3_metabinner_50 TaxID=2970812 RepID=UPI0025DB08E9|nr:GAF domain-containing protein [Chamaesiphon sp. GL140_3_metabinner_50]
MKNIASTKVSIGFISTILVLVASAVVAYNSINSVAENNRSTIASGRILTMLEKMISTLNNVEIGQREYALTNNPQYLTARRIDIDRLREQSKSLVQLKSDPARSALSNAPMSPQLTELEQTFDLHLNELAATIASRQSRVLTPARQIVLTQQGQQAIDRIRQMTTDLSRSERIALDRIQAQSRQSLADTQIAFGISGLLDLLLLAILYGLVNWDLIDKEQAESTLRDYVAEFEELYDSAPCGYYSLDANGRFLRINRTGLQMLGYEAAEIVGQKRFVDLLAPESIHTFNDNFAVVKTRGWIRDIEIQMVRKDGQIVPISATVIAIRDENGNYLSSRATIIDISDRVRLRKQSQLSTEISQKIRQSLQLEEILQTAVEEVQKLLAVDRVLIFRFDPDGSGTVVQEQVNADYPAVLGSKIADPCFDRSYYARYAQGRIYSIANITQAGYVDCYVEFLQQFAVKASSIVPIYLRDELWGLLIVHHCQSPRQWHPRELEIMVQIANQIGIALAQAQLLEREQLQRQELVRSNAELEQFAHITSHDLQEPLRMIISYLQLLSRRYEGKLDADADEFIGYAVDGATRMQALIQALLSYARLSSRKQPFEAVDCNIVVQDAIANLYVAIKESGAKISVAPLPIVWGDATQLIQLFQNLIANAIKFRGEIPPQIEIRVKLADAFGAAVSADASSSIADELAMASAWCFSIADNGIGIEPQYADRIFTIFQRLHTQVAYPGTGMGLAICKKIVERHGGTIWVESTPDRSNLESQHPNIQQTCDGAIFYFIIPAVGSTTPQHAHKQPRH